MAKNTNRSIFGRIQGLLTKNQFQHAIEAAEAALQKSPDDARLMHKLGDLYVKAGLMQQAIDCYITVAERYVNDAFFQKALAVYKQVLKLDPNRLDLHQNLAEVYLNLDRRGDCLAEYQKLAQMCETRGAKDQAVEVYRRMVDIDPDNIPVRVKLAELHLSLEDTHEAINEFVEALRQLEDLRRWNDYIKVAERLLFVDNTHLSTLKQLARVYLDLGEVKKAVLKLQKAFRLDRYDQDTLELLAASFESLQQPAKVLSVLRELAEVYSKNNQLERAHATYERIYDLDPSDERAREMMEQLMPSSLGSGSSQGITHASSGSSASLAELAQISDAHNAVQSEEQLSHVGGPATLSEEEVEQYIGEAEIYLKYGLLHRVEETINRVLPQAPNHLRLRQLRAELFEAQEDFDSAARELLSMARLVGETGQAIHFLETLLELEGVSPELQEEAYQLSIRMRNLGNGDEPSAVQEAVPVVQELPEVPTPPTAFEQAAPTPVMFMPNGGVAPAPAESYSSAALLTMPPPSHDALEASDPGAYNPSQDIMEEVVSTHSSLDLLDDVESIDDESLYPSQQLPASAASSQIMDDIASIEDIDMVEDIEIIEDIEDIEDIEIIEDIDGFEVMDDDESEHFSDFRTDTAPLAETQPTGLPNTETNPDAFAALLANREPVAPSSDNNPAAYSFLTAAPEEAATEEAQAPSFPPPPVFEAAPATIPDFSDTEAAAARLAALMEAQQQVQETEALLAEEVPFAENVSASTAPLPPPTAEEAIPLEPPSAYQSDAFVQQGLPQQSLETNNELTSFATAPPTQEEQPTNPGYQFAPLQNPTTYPEGAEEAGYGGSDSLSHFSTEAPIPEPLSEPAAISFSDLPAPPIATDKEVIPSVLALHETTPSSLQEVVQEDIVIEDEEEEEFEVLDDDLILEEFEELPFAEELEDAQLYLEQQEYQYAADLFRQILAQDPTHAEAAEGLAQAEQGLEEQKAAQDDDDLDDFLLDLDSALGIPSRPKQKKERAHKRIADEIKMFQEAVQAEIGEEEAETHFELGLAYQGMGLFDQAIAEFEACKRNNYRVIDSHKMIGNCFLSQGKLDNAVQAYENALQLPALPPQEHLDLLYELGNAHELNKNSQDAYRCFQEVAQIDGDYRGVQQRLQSLQAV